MNSETPTREDFIRFINERLTGLQFTKDPEKDLWSHEREIQTGAQTVIVNGQRMDQPGETHHVTLNVELYGDGDMKEPDKDYVERFVEINFYATEEGHQKDIGPTFCMFYDDQYLFDNVLNKIFGM